MPVHHSVASAPTSVSPAEQPQMILERITEHHAPAERRSRRERRDGHHALARQPRRAPLRQRPPSPLRAPQVERRCQEADGEQHET